MKRQDSAELTEVRIDKLVHGGQGLGELPDGRKVFVWNALPGEVVRVRLIKQKHSYAEAVAEEILEPSAERITPREAHYLATSPWQMMTFNAENRYKMSIVRELFQQSHIALPELAITAGSGKAAPIRESEAEFTSAGAMENPPGVFHYRNKMEYSFWGDDDGLHLALHQRGSHGKLVVQGSALAMPAVDAAANAICTQLGTRNARAGDLKTIIVRCNQKGDSVAALFTKLEKFAQLTLPPQLKGLRVYHSNPRSPASVPTKLLYELGDCTLQDELLGTQFGYDVDSFFQANLPIYERALTSIKGLIAVDPVDMYAGVGTIGISVAQRHVELVELHPASAAMARANLAASGLKGTVIEADTANAIQSIVSDRPVIFDPPRAGLHAKVVARILEARPMQVVYLSCNPATHARDLALLGAQYDITHFEVFNFFPRTPHIETLAVLTPKA